MSIVIRTKDQLGGGDHGWLKTKHHFSFAGWHDPDWMGVGGLRVWNDDWIAPGTGFDAHPHRDMEIVTYVRKGAITHRDSLGNEGRTEAGDVQVMSAGTGIVHAEYNLEDEPTELFQIWIIPDKAGHAPRWDAKKFPERRPGQGLVPLASGEADIEETLRIHRDATLYGAKLAKGDRIAHRLRPGRAAYLVPVGGALTVDGELVPPQGGAAIRIDDGEAREIDLVAEDNLDIVLADVPDRPQ